MSTLLTVDRIQVVYQRSIIAVHDVSFSVKSGQIVVLLGTNGAGKTTTLRAISGFLGLDDARVSSGTITFNGARIDNLPPYETARRGIILVPERDKVFPNITVTENLMAPVAHNVSRSERTRREDLVYSFFPRLAELRKRTGGLLSGGERQMLALGCALVCHPQLLLVDELSLGLAPIVLEGLMGQLVKVRSELGITIVLVEQNAVAALAVADYGYVLENGHVVLAGSAEKLRGAGRVQDSYLGKSDSGERRGYRDIKRNALQGRFHA